MCIYTVEILSSKLEENNAKIFELQGYVKTYTTEITKELAVIDTLTKKMKMYENEVINYEENDNKSCDLVTSSLNEKVEIYKSEVKRMKKIIDESKRFKEDYLYELSSLREENKDIKKSLEVLEEYSKKIISEPLGDQCGASARLA